MLVCLHRGTIEALSSASLASHAARSVTSHTSGSVASHAALTVESTLLVESASQVDLCCLGRCEDVEELGQVGLIYCELSFLCCEMLLDEFVGLCVGHLLEIDILFALLFAFGSSSVASGCLVIDVKHLEAFRFGVVEFDLLGDAFGLHAVHLCRVHTLALSAVVVLSHCGY